MRSFCCTEIDGIRGKDNSEQTKKEIATLLANKNKADEEAVNSDKEAVS